MTQIFGIPRYGWCDFQLGNFTANLSYLTDVMYNTLEMCLAYLQTGGGTVQYDRGGEGTFTLVLTWNGVAILDKNLPEKVRSMKPPPPCGICPMGVVSKMEQVPKKYAQGFDRINGFVFAVVPLSSLEHITNGLYADRTGKGLFTKPPIRWQMKPREYFYPCCTVSVYMETHITLDGWSQNIFLGVKPKFLACALPFRVLQISFM